MVTNGHTEAEGQHVTGEWVSGWRVRHLTLFPVNAETLPTATRPPPQKKEGIRNPKHGSSELRLGPPVTCACPSVTGHTFYLQDFKVNSSLRVTGFPIGHVSVEESQLRFQGSEARLKLPPSGSALSDERVSLEEV